MASNISARSIKAVHSVTATSMPFLYQTRTLCTNTKPIRQLTITHLLSRPLRSRLLHTSTTSCMRSSATLQNDKSDVESPNISKTNGPVSGERGFTIRKIAMGHKGEKPDKEEDLPWDSGSPIRPSAARNGGNYGVSEADDIQFDMDYNPFGEEDMFSEDDGEPDFSIPSPSRPGESTITLEERDTFQRIFSDIYSSSQHSLKPTAQPFANLSEINQESAREKLSSIMEEAVRIPQNTLFTSQSRDKNMHTLKQYPQALRAAAARALGLQGKPTQMDRSQPQVKRVDKHEHFRQTEQERVEAELRAAPSDLALWAVMEKEVFSLIPRLGLEEKKAQPELLKKRNGRKTVLSKIANEQKGMTPLPEPLDLNIYGPLYPAYLLFGLRLLNRSFLKPSPLSSNVLPRIKSLGLVSHVLGGSTALYNELLRIYWFRYDDFSGVIRLLEEMEESGLELDEETLGVVKDIQEMQGRYVYSQEHKTKKTPIHMLWAMPEFAPGRFKPWHNKIEEGLERQE